MNPRFKVGQYIKVTGKADKELIGTTVKVADILDGCYFIDFMNDKSYRLWKCSIADVNADVDEMRNIIYGS